MVEFEAFRVFFFSMNDKAVVQLAKKLDLIELICSSVN